eukprot:gene9003-biopygen2486
MSEREGVAEVPSRPGSGRLEAGSGRRTAPGPCQDPAFRVRRSSYVTLPICMVGAGSRPAPGGPGAGRPGAVPGSRVPCASFVVRHAPHLHGRGRLEAGDWIPMSWRALASLWRA